MANQGFNIDDLVELGLPQADPLAAEVRRRAAARAALDDDQRAAQRRAQLDDNAKRERRDRLASLGASQADLAGLGLAGPAPLPVPAAPKVAAPAPPAGALPGQLPSDFQRRYAQAYMANQQKGDTGSISYDLGDGKGMRSFDRAAPQTDAPAFADDQVFGQDRTVPTAAGGVSSPGAVSRPGEGIDSEAYRQYLRNTGHLDDFEREKADVAEAQAREARGQALTADPFAQEMRAFQLEALKTQLGIGRDRARVQSEHDVKFGPMYDQANADRERALASVDANSKLTPQERDASKKIVEAKYADRKRQIDALDARSLSPNELAAAMAPNPVS